MRNDVVDAVLAVDFDDLSEIANRAGAVMTFIKDADFEKLIAGFNRVVNLAAKAEQNIIDESLLKEPQEQALYECFTETKTVVREAYGRQDYLTAYKAMANLLMPINAFFDNLMVMVDDNAVRNNRLALLRNLADLYTEKTDWSKLKLSEIL